MRMCPIGDREEESTACSGDAIFKVIEDFSSEGWTLLAIRGKVLHPENVCKAHENKYLKFYELRQKYCSDPFEKDGLRCVKFSHSITYTLYLKVRHSNLHPGRGLCSACYYAVVAKAKGFLSEQIMDMPFFESSAYPWCSLSHSGSSYFLSLHVKVIEVEDKSNLCPAAEHLASDIKESNKLPHCEKEIIDITACDQCCLAVECRNHIKIEKKDIEEWTS